MKYSVCYDVYSGSPTAIRFDGYGFIPIDLNNRDFKSFLEWNSSQTNPLDYLGSIENNSDKSVVTNEKRLEILEGALQELMLLMSGG